MKKKKMEKERQTHTEMVSVEFSFLTGMFKIVTDVEIL